MSDDLKERLAKYGLDVLAHIEDMGWGFGEAYELSDMAVLRGLMRCEEFDPEGKHAGIMCDSDPGDMIYLLADDVNGAINAEERKNP